MSKESLFFITGVIKGCFTARVLSTLSLLVYHEYILFPSVTCISEFTLNGRKEAGSILQLWTAVWNQSNCFRQKFPSWQDDTILLTWNNNWQFLKETPSSHFGKRTIPKGRINLSKKKLQYEDNIAMSNVTRKTSCYFHWSILQKYVYKHKTLLQLILMSCVDSLRLQQANIDTCT